MDFISSTILSGLLYDGLKGGAKLSVELLKEKLQGWLIDDSVAELLVDQLKDKQIERLNAHYIQEEINSSSSIMECLKQIKPDPNCPPPSQVHYGSGDNVGRDKVIYQK
ncbi:GapS6a family protein [Vibrio coralliilyticus]|uniref:GapS6a family protein n=1 Tax=Vibrio coralliilyticus TaxID=190893 RepID=UPI000BAAD402|nr:hypothetical protein [Vibrio coralliilyticus]NOI56210.1 hypothetical protein [Vibrio coralliilyticus]PAT69262.1 hypothetical protein CKA27_00460 [Vibrio coralliilyticus]